MIVQHKGFITRGVARHPRNPALAAELHDMGNCIAAGLLAAIGFIIVVVI